ncbi:MAG: N-acetyl-gamma-glutamyl-phosphate reductase [Candidatus Dormibacteraceae bacterium]
MTKVRVAVAGANGYAGMTLVSLLLGHPAVELVQLTSRSLAGRPYSSVFPLCNLEGTFEAEPDPGRSEVIFSCLPHGVGAAAASQWVRAGVRVIDLSADFRLHDPDLYPLWYGAAHPAPELLPEAVLGLPELHAEAIRQARIIACPGCYSTAAILALAPAAARGWLGPDVVVDAKSGASGAGRSLSLGTHFAELDESVRAYGLAGHRHHPELTQELAQLSPSALPPITFLTHLVPMVRGILSTCYFDLVVAAEELEAAYRDFYAGQTFTRLVPESPPTKLVSHTNYCAVNVSSQGGKAIVTAALDNLLKGAAGQAVECFNLAFGLEPGLGLEGGAQWP